MSTCLKSRKKLLEIGLEQSSWSLGNGHFFQGSLSRILSHLRPWETDLLLALFLFYSVFVGGQEKSCRVKGGRSEGEVM